LKVCTRDGCGGDGDIHNLGWGLKNKKEYLLRIFRKVLTEVI